MAIHHQDDETRDRYKATWRSLCWVLLLTGLVRCLFLVAMHDNLNQDPDAYRKLARNYLESSVYGWKTEPTVNESNLGITNVRPTAFRPPLYPAVLIAIGGAHSNWPIAILHLVLGVATAGLAACVGWRMGLGNLAIVAAMFVALDPILLQQSTLVMTETLATFLVVLTMFFLCAKSTSPCAPSFTIRAAVGAGLALGLCVLCRPTFLPWLGLIALTHLAQCRKPRFESFTENSTAMPRLAHVAILVGTSLIVMAPWVIRNQIVLGKSKLTTTHGGYTVLLGNNPAFYRFLRSGSEGTWDGEQLGRAWQARSLTIGPDDEQWNDLAKLALKAEQQSVTGTTSEFDDDRLAYALAKKYIREQPSMFAYACVLRVTRLWRWAPHRVGSESTLRLVFRFLVGGWYATVMGLAVYGLVRLGRRVFQTPWLFAVQLCFVFTAVHTLYWSNMRMRAPLMPLVCLAAASGMAAIYQQVKGRKALL